MAEEYLQSESNHEDVVLEVRDVTKTFPGVIANADVNMKLRRGEILALLGENGAGKSTLMNIIYGLYHQDRGEIYLNGREVRFASAREAIRSGIGMVHQHFQLVDVMTVAENVILGEEKEAPTWSSLFNAFFTFVFGVLMTVLLLNYNDPLVYTSVTLAIVGLLLPWYLRRYAFTPIGFSLIAFGALLYIQDWFRIGYSDQYLFVDLIIILGILLVLYFLYGIRLSQRGTLLALWIVSSVAAIVTLFGFAENNVLTFTSATILFGFSLLSLSIYLKFFEGFVKNVLIAFGGAIVLVGYFLYLRQRIYVDIFAGLTKDNVLALGSAIIVVVFLLFLRNIYRLFFEGNDNRGRWLVLGLQTFAIIGLLMAGADRATPWEAFGDYGEGTARSFSSASAAEAEAAAATDAIRAAYVIGVVGSSAQPTGTLIPIEPVNSSLKDYGLLLADRSSNEFEIIIALLGTFLIGLVGFAVPRILGGNSPLQSGLARYAPAPAKLDNKVWYTVLSLGVLGALGLAAVGLVSLLFTAIWPDNNDFLRWREFMGLASFGLVLTTLMVAALSFAATLIFKSWTEVVGGLRIAWGLAWRVGLIGVAVWVGTQAYNISQMALITNLLQTPVEVVASGETPRDVEDATVEGFAVSERLIEPNWRTIDRETSHDAQIQALLTQIDENFTDQETGEYVGISPEWRDAVDDVPPVIEDVVVGILLVLFGVLAVRTWRGNKLLPSALGIPSLGIMGVLVAVYAVAIFYLLDEVSLAAKLVFVTVGLAATGTGFYFTYQDRQHDPDRIRPITPLDTMIDAIADFFYTVLSVRRTHEAAERVRELSIQYGLEVDPYAVVEKLPVGLQQRVEIIKALYRKADILILDEPTAVLTPQEGEELFKIMRELASQGVSIIFITHKLKEVFKVATNIVVMRGGRVVGATTPTEANEASLAAMMVGRDVILRVEKDEAHPDAAILCVEDLKATDDRGAKALAGVSFEVRTGEVLGIAGVQGNGQSELVEVLTGLRPMDAGAVELLGQQLKPKEYPDADIFRRGAAVLIDFFVVGVLAAFFSYFWSYFSGGVEGFTLKSRQTLIMFVVLDALYTLTLWILPLVLSNRGPDDENAIVNLADQTTTPTRHTAGQTFGKVAMNVHITQQHDLAPTFWGLIIRYLGQTLTRYLFPLPLALNYIFTKDDDPKTGNPWRFVDLLGRAWYDQLPLVNCRITYHSAITPRKIKDLASSHVPEDRLRFGMVKPFSVAENLILNDYYQAPHAKQPSALQLPFVTAVYSVIFGSIFAVLGYIWLYLWNNRLWDSLLDSYGVPSVHELRTVPTSIAMSTAQRNNLNDPLLVSLVILLVMVILLSIVAYFLTRTIMRYLTKPLTLVPPMVFFGLAYVFVAGINEFALVVDLQQVWLPFIGIIHSIFDSTTNNGPTDRILFYGAILVLLVLAGLVYEQIRPQVNEATYAGLSHSAVGQSLLAFNERGLLLNIKDAAAYSDQLIQRFDIRTPSALTSGGSLSGGNQQKVVVAREFSRQPRLLIASQPTRGIDVGSIEFIHKQIISQRDQGAAVLLVSAELDEVMSLSDRIAVMYKGEIIKVVDAKDATREELGLLMAGINRAAH